MTNHPNRKTSLTSPVQPADSTADRTDLPAPDRGMTQMSTNEITDATLALFLAYAHDSGNWGGEPLIGAGGNVSRDERAERGNITQMKKAGLVTTFVDRGDSFLVFTDAGRALAAKHNVEVRG